MRLPLLLASLAAFLLLLGTGLMLVHQKGQSSNTARQQTARDLSDTAEQLSVVVASGSSAQTVDSSEWAHSDRMARLVAAGDVQVKELVESYGVFSFFSSDRAAAREVNVDWKLLREGLLSFNRSMQTAAPAETTPTPSVAEPVAVTPSVTEVPQAVLQLASDFEQIRSRVIEGTRVQSLINLVNNSSLGWARITDSQGVGLQALVAEQRAYAAELLRLSRVGTDTSLYGYYTSDQIIQFVNRVNNIQLPVATPVSESSAVKEPEVVEKISAPPVVVSNAFVTEALLQLQNTVAVFLDTTSRRKLINWLVPALLTAALLTLFTALWQLMRAARAGQSLAVGERVPPVVATPHAAHDAGRPEAEPATDHRPNAEPLHQGAMSVWDADQLIQDIDAIAAGDLRYSVRVPRRGHGKVIAESANRTASVMQNLVGMTRGVANRIDGVVMQHDQISRSLAEQDIRRQSETAELSDSISIRSALLDKQQLVLTGSNELIKEIETRSESAVNGVKDVSTSLARVSAQVEVSNGRMHRLLQTAVDVTESTDKLKLLAEQARLQALNVSLKMPEQNQEQLFELESDNIQSSSDDRSNAAGLFDDIHQLTGRLVQISSDTAALITMLQSEIEQTAVSLKNSSDEINESARHTHTSSLLGKELSSYCDQLQHSIKDALSNVETQKSELSQTARRIVRLDKTGNNTSELTQVLTQDVTELQTMAAKLQESVAGFKLDGVEDTGAAMIDPGPNSDPNSDPNCDSGAEVHGKTGSEDSVASTETGGGSVTGDNPLA